MKRKPGSYYARLQKLADEYFAESGAASASTREIAVWMIRNNKWEAPDDIVLHACQEDFAKALREQFIEDETGHAVRAKHAARIKRNGEQQYLWADIRRAPKGHMEIAFQQRRQQIVGDCRQLKRDVDFFNNLHPDNEPVQMVFDFTEDVAEGEFSGEFQVA